MGGADIDDMGIASNVIVLMVKFHLISHPVSGQQVLKFLHGCCVVRSVVKSEVANLNWRVNIRPHRQ